MLSRRHTPTPSRRANRSGFTLIEITIAAIVSAIVLLLLLRWLASMVGVASAANDIAVPRRDVAYVADQIQLDTERSTVCHPHGLSAPLHSIGTHQVGLYLDDDLDGTPELVLWRVDAGALQRAVITGSDCIYDTTTPTWVTYADRVVTTDVIFAGIVDGNVSAYYGDCQTMNAEECLFEALEVRLTVTSPGPDAVPVTYNTALPLNLSASRL